MAQMAEEFINDSLPDLKELENKVGRKTPESLLIWMKDAADCEETCCDVDNNNHFSDDFSEKIRTLKQEMRWLRSTDVRILRQLLAVHEGIEAMRWLEERGASLSQTSSLTGSLSSLVTVDESGLSLSRCRDSLTIPLGLTESTMEEPLHTADGISVPKNHLIQDDALERHASIFSAHRFEEGRLESRPEHCNRAVADPVRSALLRSSGISRRRENSSSSREYSSEESQTKLQLQESVQDFKTERTNRDNIAEEEDKLLLGYDAQWCWVESQDDVTFL